MDSKLMRLFKNPTSPYRGKPFWAWNGRLEPAELRSQIRTMKQMGMGGFFMHSRIGLATEYLSDDWFDMVAVCIDEAQRLGMEAWLYDEDRWPSGAAGGIVTRNPRFRMRYLSMTVMDKARDFNWNNKIIAAFTAEVRGHRAYRVRRVPRGDRPSLTGQRRVLCFRVKTAPRSDWYNGYTYLDTLNPEAVREFIRVTHGAYRKRFGRYFGNVVPGIFIDEPNHGLSFFSLQDTNDGKSIPWTPKLPSAFKGRYGYDLLDHLPALFLDVDGRPVTPARYHYHDCTTDLFVESFARQLGRWCSDNDLILTGHVLFESMLSNQTSAVGSCMRFYEHMHAPGMDLLTEFSREYDSAKQVSSSARQFGNRWRLTETYGCTGWGFTFSGHKAVGDWQAALGLNLRSHHLAWYTMEGQTKRDYPASISYQSPWHDAYRVVEDYFSRVHTIMTRGQERRDLLVIHPIESSWLLCRKGWSRGWATAKHVQNFDEKIVKLRDTLLAANIDFDYGDEEVLARHGGVLVQGGRALFQVNQARYKAVVIPPMTTMRDTTLRLIEEYKAAGGTVIFAGDIARYVNAVPSKAVSTFSDTCKTVSASGTSLVRAVEAVSRVVSITDPAGRQIVPVLHLLREDRQAYYLFVCNVGHDFRRGTDDIAIEDRNAQFGRVRIRLSVDYDGHPIEMDPQTGDRFKADTRTCGGAYEVHTSLPKLGSRIFIFPKRGKNIPALSRRKALTEVSCKPVRPSKWDITLSECNNIVLDRARYRIGTRPWRAARDILRVDRSVRTSLGLPFRTWHMTQPWAEDHASSKNINTTVSLRYDFTVDAIPAGELYLALEQPSRYQVTINGESIPTGTDCGWWTDRSLRKVALPPGLLKPGPNHVTLTGVYDATHPGLEAVHLLGRFGARVQGSRITLTDPPASLRLGDWTQQGLAFYSGSVQYRTTIRPRSRGASRWFVRVPDFKGVAVRVTLNGQSAGVVGWAPYEVEITDWIKGDPVELGIEVIGHRRNSHGPLHLSDPKPRFIGPIEYETTGKLWSDDYRLVPMGLMKPPVLIHRK
jgi:alpha-L-rhamnosidase